MAKDKSYPVGHVKYGLMGPITEKEHNSINFNTQDINTITQKKFNRSIKSSLLKNRKHLDSMSKLPTHSTAKYGK